MLRPGVVVSHNPIYQRIFYAQRLNRLPIFQVYVVLKLVSKAMVFPVVMYGCESWTIKKAEHRRFDTFELWC